MFLLFCVTKETAQGCVGSRIDLQCSPTKVIRVTNVHLGISGCKEIRCCIKDAGCSRKPSEKQLKSVKGGCEGQQNCTLVISALNLAHCNFGWWLGKRTVDGHAFERITYSCTESKSSNF